MGFSYYLCTFGIFIASIAILIKILRLFRIGRVHQRPVFITGCDSGFGRELAIRLDKKGIPVYAGCLFEKSLQELIGGCSSRLKPIQIDVTDTSSVRAAAEFVRKDLGDKALWGIVNNAGIGGALGPLEWIPKEQSQRAMDVNLWGMYDVTREFLSLIKRGKEGRIVNMSSAMGRICLNSMGYAMSKYAVQAFSDTLSNDLQPFNITVHVLEPGFYKTPIVNGERIRREFMQSLERASPESKEEYGGDEYANACAEFFIGPSIKFASTRIEDVVDAYEHALFAKYPHNRYPCGLHAKYIYIPLSHFPLKFQKWVFGIMFKATGFAFPVPKCCKKE